MKSRKNPPKKASAGDPTNRWRRRGARLRAEREDYPDFVLGDGSRLDFDNPDLCHALSMAKRD